MIGLLHKERKTMVTITTKCCGHVQSYENAGSWAYWACVNLDCPKPIEQSAYRTFLAKEAALQKELREAGL
jgi:hypothetical protein